MLRTFRWHLFALLLLPLLAADGGLRAQQLPDLGGPGAAVLSPEQEYRLGRAWLRNLRSRVNLLEDPMVQDYVEHLVYRLASHSDLKEPDLAIAVVNNRDINAFAVPGGVIGLNAGLFLHARSEDELGAVIAHEIAHVSQKHFSRRYADSQRMNRAVLAAMLASLAVAIAGDPQIGMAGLATSQAAGIQSQLAYSRHHEREADRVGMQTLANAGMDPHAMPRFFERMQRSRQFAGSPPEFVMTHPITEERIADSRARAERMERPQLHESPGFSLARARIEAGFIREPKDAVSHFRDTYGGGNSVAQQAAGFGLAVSLTRNGDYDEAEEILKELTAVAPDQFWYRLALAEVAETRGDHETAVARLEALHEIMPGNYATSVLLARNLLAIGEPTRARRLLEPLAEERPDEPLLWRMLGESWGREGDMARAQLARGEYLFSIGREQQGRRQLRFALDKSEGRTGLHSRIRSRLQEMERLSEEDFFR